VTTTVAIGTDAPPARFTSRLSAGTKTLWALSVQACAAVSIVLGLHCCRDAWAVLGLFTGLGVFTTGVVLLADALRRGGCEALERSLIAAVVIRIAVEPVMVVDMVLGGFALTFAAEGDEVSGFFTTAAVVLVCGTLNLVVSFVAGIPFGFVSLALKPSVRHRAEESAQGR
jgi:hypothetical protein